MNELRKYDTKSFSLTQGTAAASGDCLNESNIPLNI